MLKYALPGVALLVGIGGAMALTAAQSQVKTQTPESPAPRVTVIKVQPETMRYTVTTHGTVTPRTEVDLTVEVAGRVTSVHPNFVEGGFFEKGDVIVTIDDTGYKAALASAKAQLARAEALLQREQAESALAAREWERYGEGEPDALVLRKPQLAEAQANVDSATAGVTKAQNDLDRTVIKAPYAGRIRAKLIEEGQFAGMGAPVARVYATDYAEVRLPVSGAEIGFLNLPLGRTLEYEDEAAPSVELSVTLGRETSKWEARIVRTEAEVDPRTRMYFAVARVKNPYTPEAAVPLLPNTFVQAGITGREAQQVFVIPRRAVRPDGRVLVVDASSRIRFREVSVIRTTENEVVVDTGLEEGERVVVSQLETSVEGMVVETISSKSTGETP